MKVLYAWEIGEDLGHITQFLPLALELRHRGHDVVTALRELPRAEEVIGRHGITMLQAPIWQGELLDPPKLPISYAEILFFYGYLDAQRLVAMIKAWIGLISLVAPDIMIADHAPTALIAARVLGIPRTTMGAGFFLPPATNPLQHAPLDENSVGTADTKRSTRASNNQCCAPGRVSPPARTAFRYL